MQIWPSKTKKDELEWTSLRGSDRKKLLERLPAKILEIFDDEQQLGIKIANLWKVIFYTKTIYINELCISGLPSNLSADW